jgi:uncharacterized membrane protein
MAENQGKIDQLLARLELLVQQQSVFQKEIDVLRSEIINLKTAETQLVQPEHSGKLQNKEPAPERRDVEAESILTSSAREPEESIPIISKIKAPKIKSDLEKFIGENLINKIGIIIIFIGVIIGAKYAIDHQLISPLTRISLGYMVGLGFLGVAIRLKRNYENFSAVLLSGSMAIMYFITFAAYDFYQLIPQTAAFFLMVLFTIFTVIAALNYDNQTIAQIGLAGAYGIPFLLSNDTGRVAFLFSYIAIINAGILAISIKKYWKPLYYTSFVLTWLIFSAWYMSEFTVNKYFGFALSFAFIFFILFHLTFLIYKIKRNKIFSREDIILLLPNAFIFYGYGYNILDAHAIGAQLLGLYTLGNAVIHFITSMIIYRRKAFDRNLLYLLAGLTLVFVTIAIPVQLDGSWVTLLWVSEAALLFWIGRTKQSPVYEKISYPLMILAFFSLIQDWSVLYNNYNPDQPDSWLRPLANINFLTSVLFGGAFAFVNFINFSKKYASGVDGKDKIARIMKYVIPGILLIVIYYAFRLEIENYFNQLYRNSRLKILSNSDTDYPYFQLDWDLVHYKNIWVINYSLFFMTILSIVNIKKFKNRLLGLINLGLNALALGAFLVIGLYALSELRGSYLNQLLSEYYERGIFNIYIRYISLIFAAGIITVSYYYIKQDFLNSDLKITFDFLLHGSVLWIISSELLNWMDIFDSSQSYKLGLSILWGAYALFMIILGIWKKKRYLRIAAICLFAATLIKLFFYDVAHLGTIAKTILFLSLGILLLIISFLYNKYKSLIFDETTT